ncbi:TetR family transcriptional regulator [Rhodococcus triatomae]
MADARVGRRTGRPPTLTADDIVTAALGGDLAALSMPAVAKRLGVSHSALYRYFPDRESLLRACADRVVRATDWPDVDQPWRDLLSSMAGALWSCFDSHPGLAQVALTLPGTPPALVTVVDAIVASLCAQGFVIHDAVLAVDFVSEVTILQHASMAALDDVVSDADSRSTRQAHQDSWRESGVVTAGGLDEAAWHGRGWLEGKLAVILDGLERRLER